LCIALCLSVRPSVCLQLSYGRGVGGIVDGLSPTLSLVHSDAFLGSCPSYSLAVAD